jgi:hypothetical protein
MTPFKTTTSAGTHRATCRTAAALCALALAVLATPAGAQTATAPAQEVHRKTMMFGGQFTEEPLQSINVYTVPSNRSFRITDLILTNSRAEYCDVTIGASYEIRLAPNSTLPLSFHSGPTFGPGEVVTIVSTWRLAGHGDSCRPIYTIMGYTFTPQ